jgi:hypothetical protein
VLLQARQDRAKTEKSNHQLTICQSKRAVRNLIFSCFENILHNHARWGLSSLVQSRDDPTAKN